MGNNFSKHSYDKKEEEFEKFWNENYNIQGFELNKNRFRTMSEKARKSDNTLIKSNVRKQWFLDQQMDDQDLDFSKYWSFLPIDDPCFQPQKTK